MARGFYIAVGYVSGLLPLLRHSNLLTPANCSIVEIIRPKSICYEPFLALQPHFNTGRTFLTWQNRSFPLYFSLATGQKPEIVHCLTHFLLHLQLGFDLIPKLV